jgi:hypothetical protein
MPYTYTIAVAEFTQTTLSTGLSSTNDLINLVERLAAALLPAKEPLAHWEQLEKAVTHNLTTSFYSEAVVS